jgi:hypothetical protein
MTSKRLLLPFVASLALLAGCSPSDLPKTPADASAKVDSFKATMTSFGEKVGPAVDTTKTTLTAVGEATEAGIETTKSTLETVGTVTEKGVNATVSGLEAVGNTVIEIRDGKPAPQQQPEQEQPAQ